MVLDNLIWPIIFAVMVMGWGIYWSVPHGKKHK